MSSAINAISEAANTALENAKKECNTDISVDWFLVDPKKPGSAAISSGNFSNSHQVYLETITPPNTVFFSEIPDSPGSLASEQGADAIADISKYYDWDKGACRSILYISDSILEEDGSSEASNDAAVNQAISVANSHHVTVFAHRIDPYTGATFGGISSAVSDPDYVNLCSATGGVAEIGGKPSAKIYKKLITRAVCDCGKGCKEVKIPDIKPCISISWGDSDCDSIETDDFEKLCITVCNCYSNVTFCDFNIFQIEVTDCHGCPVALLPDGTPSVDVVPVGPFCFGDIKPCSEGEASCVSREFVLNTCGAIKGKYQIKLDAICFEVKYTYSEEACFKFDLCKS